MDFLKVVFTDLFSKENAEVLLHSVRSSTSHQYDCIWSSFCSFVKAQKPSVITDTFVLSFLRFLFYKKGLAPTTITSYKSALIRPLKYAFGLDLGEPFYIDFLKALANLRPNRPLPPVRWSVDKALSLALSDRFQRNPSLEDRTMCTIFLLALATGARVSEMGAFLRGDDDIVFSEGGMTLYPNPNFLAKNEHPLGRRNPLWIQSLLDSHGNHLPLCPVQGVKKLLNCDC